MEQADIIDICQEAIIVMLKIGAPMLIVALVVGVGISLLQALTQMQETTLSFVPKIVAMFLAALIALPFMFATLIGFTERLMERVGSL
ncbi:MAG: flagellar biosynthesis protein FliQ [Dongiaceae bacterium]